MKLSGRIVTLVSVFSLLLSAILLAPAAVAQVAPISIVFKEFKDPAPGTPNVKVGGNTRLPALVTAQVLVTFTVSGNTGQVCPIAPITVTFGTKDTPGDGVAAIQFSPSNSVVTLTQTEQQGTAKDVSTTVSITPAKSASAFKAYTFKVTATVTVPASTSGCDYAAPNPNTVDASLNFIVDYIPIMEFVPAKYIQKTGQNKDVVFSVKMNNLGNSQTKVETSITPLSKSKLDVVTPPSQITLDSKQESGDKATVAKDVLITARTPHSNGYTNQLYSFTASFDYTAVQTAKDVAKDSQSVVLSVQVQGVYAPGIDPASSIAALGLGLLMLGFVRRKESE